ncbi:MAG: SpvB/TcaC N-terminal domain-containing protein [Flavobacterium sp.]|uniref:toxin TcdB middle/N-terminal domain-containing protein n=1 Tax=Flavobacterium sp. TaxID=239 RepID=UPI0022CB1A44|nr:toxin TcdB middle/N-terminal domain-containing protein [Flavobacterium sp.]MCZ8296204.1 SpvB/TcaC N-terminal domain-containing protein [Flavobacterium sp.]
MEIKDKNMGFNRITLIVFHRIMLVSVLFNTLVAPCQNMIIDVYGPKIPLNYYGSQSNLTTENKNQSNIPINISEKKVLSGQKATTFITTYSINSDIQVGVIGRTITNPVDDISDNVFTFHISDLPNKKARVFLTYELYGVQDLNAVSRSINDRPATGGYMVKIQNGWTAQKEEVNLNWLHKGDNTIIFGIPQEGNFQYKVKNLKLEFEVSTSEPTLLVVNKSYINYTKDNTLYIKGFLRKNNASTKVYIEDTPLNLVDGEFEGFYNITDLLFKNRHFAIIKAYDDLGLLGQEVISLDNLIQADSKITIESYIEPFLSKALALQKTILKFEDVTLKINDSSLIEDKEIKIIKLRNVDIPPMSNGLVNVTKNGSAYRLLPDGTVFNKAVDLEIGYDEALIPKGHNSNEIKTYFFDTHKKCWTPIERDSIDKINKTIISTTNHFTDYINGVIQAPESPETAGFTPTMMNDIKAVDPSSEMTLIAPPSVSQSGDANVSYPIKVPAGRKGVQPQIAIQYSSEAGNGWLGQGWNISQSAISIDTKWGSPIFDPSHESEIYSLNGEQLMYPKHGGQDWMPNRHYDVASAPLGTYNTQSISRLPNLQFTTRKQSSFAKIERLGTSTSNYFWKVTGSDGSISWYGGKNAVSPNAVIRNANNDIVHWALYMSEDVYGNCIKYEYDNYVISPQSGQNENLNGGVVFNLNRIQYTGYNDANYQYEVVFNSTQYIRQDVGLNLRLGVKQVTPYFLNEIIVKKINNNDPIRKYRLNIGYGKFNKGQLKSVSELDKNNTVFYTHSFEYYDDVSVGAEDVFFAEGEEEVICNDTAEPCLDSDNDGVCNENDPCPNVAGPESNNGCPENIISNCYQVQFPSGNIFNECLAGGVKVIVNGVNLPGQPFNNLNSIIAALQIYHPVSSYNLTNNVLTISNTNQIYTSIDIASINFSCGWKLNFSNCSNQQPRLTDISFKRYFSNFAENNSFVIDSEVPITNPCGNLFTNDEFLIQGQAPSFDATASILGSSKSQAISTGFYIGLGVGKNKFTKMTTFGMQWNWGNDKSIAFTSLIDINGDGLDDIVSKEGNNLYYKKHVVTRTYDSNNEPIVAHSFEPKRPIVGIDNFYRSFGRNRSSNFQITFGLRRIGGFIGWDKSKSTSETDIYITDGNGDGLPDIVRDGVVYFNRLDANGNPKFMPDSRGTENLVITAAPKSIDLPDTSTENEIALPAFDVVKVWEAPADGTIKIDNTIQLTDSSKESIVSVEMKKAIPENCYSVSFAVPYTSIKRFGVGIGYDKTRISPVQISSIFKKLTINQLEFLPSSKLYLTNGDINGERNDCLNYSQLTTPYWFVNNPNPNQSSDFVFRCNAFLNNIENIFQNTSTEIYTYYASQNGCSGCCSEAIVDYTMFGSEMLSQSVNTLSTTYAWERNNQPLITIPCSPDNSNWIGSEHTLIRNPTIITSGISTFIAVNGINISNLPYTLANTNEFLTFKNDFENQYPNSSVTLNIQTNIITITVNNTTSSFNTITLSPSNNSNSNSYNFLQYQCSGNSSRIFQELADVNKNDWEFFRLTNEELKVIHKKRISEGEWIIPEEFSFEKNEVNEKIISGNFKIELIKERQKAQDAAKKWLDEYNNKQKELNSKISKNFAQRTINQTTCNETPNNLCLLYGTLLNSTNVSIINTLTANCENQPLTVKKGDRIYFRVHSVDNGNPPVNWDPKVEYTDSGLSTITDANGHKPFSSSYSDGFVLSGNSPVTFPGNSGTAKVSWTPFTITPTDTVTYQIIQETVASSISNEDDPPTVVSSAVIYSKVCHPNVSSIVSPQALPIDLNNIVITAPTSPDNLTQTFFYFKVLSSSNVDWRNSQWKPSMEFTTSTSISPNPDGSNPEGNLLSTTTVYPIADYDLYRFFPCGTAFTKKDISTFNNGTGLSILPQLAGVFSAGDNGTINFVVKRGTIFVGKREFVINNGVVTVNNSSAIPLGNSGGNHIEIMFTVDDSNSDDNIPSLLSKLALTSNPLAVIQYGANSVNVPKTEISLYQKNNAKFGSFFRQWGQFMYRPENVQNALPGFGSTKLIKEEALQVSLSQSQANQLNTDFSTINDSMTSSQLTAFQNNYQNLIDSLVYITANPTRENSQVGFVEKWIGLHNENYAAEASSRAEKLNQSVIIFEDNYPNIEQGVVNTGAYAISKYSKGYSNNNFSAGINGYGFGINGSISNNGQNNSLTDYVDFNGDRYPDIVTKTNIQFTNKTGGLLQPVASNGQNISTSSSDSFGFGASGSFGKSNQESGDANSSDKNGFERFDGFKGNSGAGISGNFSNGNSNTQRLWTDINGDGLADLLETNSGSTNVTLNQGAMLQNSPSNNWGLLPLFNSKSRGISGGLGVNKWQGSVEAGISLTTSWNETTTSLVDINGDGLLDMIYADNELGVKLNLGNRFVDKGIWSSYYNLKNESASTSASLNTGFTFALIWKFWGWRFKIPALNWNGTPLSTSTNRTKKSLTDFDGDGYVDLVEEVGPNTVKIYHSRIRRTDKLKTVTNPLGGQFTIDYKVQPKDYNNPNAQWVMSDLVVYDNYDKVNDGEDVYKKHFVYEQGKYDRREREFYGYKTVKTEDYILDTSGNSILYRTSITNYHNSSYFLHGLVDESYVIKGGDVTKKYTRTKNYYEIHKLNNQNDEIVFSAQPMNYDVGGSEGRRSAIVLLKKTINELYELNSSPQITTEVNLEYDSKGRIVKYIDKGNLVNTNDDYISTISYHASLAGLNILNLPKSIQVSSLSGTIYRERKTDVDPSNGNITSVYANNNGTWLQTAMEYDVYGNLTHVRYPQNSNGESMFYYYTYDSDYHKYIVSIKDAFGYSSTASYDSDFDKIIETVDLTGNKMLYSYDSFGRNTLIIAPKEIASGNRYTIKFDYYPYPYLLPSSSGVTSADFVPVAVTRHFDQQHPTNDIETYTFIDGLARPIQVKKDIWINRTNDPHNTDFIEGLSVSGKSFYDELGRVTQQFHPWWEAKSDATKFLLNEYASPYQSTTDYDELDRPIKTTDPEGNESTVQYSLATDVNGVMAIKTKSDVDQNGTQHIVTETYKDVAGRVISTKNQGGSNGSIWTKFNYNEIGELLAYTDTENLTTKYKYDMLGRKVMVNHPDNGVTTLSYDNVNLVSLQTANLQNVGAMINYQYEINRLTHVNYPDNPNGDPNIANVIYKYGDTGNQTGRLIYQQDATGTQEFDYGNMGEMITNIRTVVGPNIPTRIFETRFQYDSWNRLQGMVYPDGEKIAFTYDLGGNLNRMTGEYNGAPYDYIKRIDYDYYEQRSYLLYGNATETYYNYTPALRRLENLQVKTSNGNDLFNNLYAYDKVGNVLAINNIANITSNNMAGSYNHRFEYDNLNRLVKARGSFLGSSTQLASGNDANADYSLIMKYNDTHGIINKSQVHFQNGVANNQNTYNNDYKYYANSHKVEIVTDGGTGAWEHFRYDLNGNIISRETNSTQREFSWDESNRLRVVSDNHSMQHYIYDASGERVLKANSDFEAIYENGSLINGPGTVSINGYTSYPSAFVVVTSDGVYSKHYYAGSQRIVSRLGDADASIFEVGCPGCKQSPSKSGFEPIQLQQAQKNDLQNYALKLQKGKIIYKDYKPIPLAEQEKAIAEDDAESTVQRAPTVYPMYYYHPDHLGTSTSLTDFNGNAYQFFLNLPFGETMAQQLGSNYYNSPYKFNGKELDEETGLYYYGARYYDPRISIFQSTDQMAEKYPNLNPYAYCFSNPINLIDPSGMEPEDPPAKNIYIVLDYNANIMSGDKNRETIEFQGMEKEGWYGIYACDIKDASNQLSSYLGNTKANNVVLETHGGHQNYMNSNGEVIGTGTYISTDNNNGQKINDLDLKKSIEGSNTKNQSDVSALLSIVNSINEGGNFYLQTCNTADSDNFFNNLGTLTGNSINLFGTTELCGPRHQLNKSNESHAIYKPGSKGTNLFDRNTILTGAPNSVKMYQAGCPDGPPIIFNGIKINKNGIIPF